MFPNTLNFPLKLGCASFFNSSILSVWKHDQTLVQVFDILLTRSVESYRRLSNATLGPIQLPVSQVNPGHCHRIWSTYMVLNVYCTKNFTKSFRGTLLTVSSQLGERWAKHRELTHNSDCGWGTLCTLYLIDLGHVLLGLFRNGNSWNDQNDSSFSDLSWLQTCQNQLTVSLWRFYSHSGMRVAREQTIVWLNSNYSYSGIGSKVCALNI